MDYEGEYECWIIAEKAMFDRFCGAREDPRVRHYAVPEGLSGTTHYVGTTYITIFTAQSRC